MPVLRAATISPKRRRCARPLRNGEGLGSWAFFRLTKGVFLSTDGTRTGQEAERSAGRQPLRARRPALPFLERVRALGSLTTVLRTGPTDGHHYGSSLFDWVLQNAAEGAIV